MKNSNEQGFTCFCFEPAERGGRALAVAASRCGHQGLLDITRCGDDLLGPLLADLPPSIGLRVGAHQFRRMLALAADAAAREIVLSAPELLRADGLIDAARQAAATGITPWVEVPSMPVLDTVRGAELDVRGLVVRGQEAAGWCGESSAMVLLQAALAAEAGPVIVHGGLGIGGMAACRAAGAAGAVLDDQLLLLRESPLNPTQRGWLEDLDVDASVLAGTALDAPCRFLKHARFRLAKSVRDRASALEGSAGPGDDGHLDWFAFVEERLGFGAPGESLWPAGQGIGFAAEFGRRHRTLGRLLSAIEAQTPERIATAARRTAAATERLTERLGTRCPVVQGPMTRVSDTPTFAAAVARAGALPTLALGVMRGDQVEALLGRCRETLADRPWGVGVLGFLEPALLQPQLDAIVAARPPFAVLAGGQPRQAQALEAAGIKTFVHVPSPSLVRRFTAEGVRRFIFEGRECGGHIGPTSSLLLWEAASAELIEALGASLGEAEVLFAGGIHDAASCGMAATLAAPLLEAGAAWGVLMGSAYVYTREAVETGALVAGFQQAALACRRTVALESAPGHANRCADTPFARHFSDQRRSLLRARRSAADIRQDLDALLLGRLRSASKGITRSGDAFVELSPEEQQREGMYMIGDCAVLKQGLTTLDALHGSVSEGALEWLQRSAARCAGPAPAAAAQPDPQPSDIAIIGIGMLAPGATDLEQFWRIVLDSQPQMREIPRERWDWRLYDDAEGTDPDASICRWGCFFDAILFDPLLFNIPPNSVAHITPAQLLMLEITRRALIDAGYEDGGFDRENTAVIFGAADAAGFVGDAMRARAMSPLLAGPYAGEIKARTPELASETFAGGLTSIVAGRVANRFDCGGPNLTVDAACASGLTAVDLGIQALESGRANLCLVGAVDAGQSPGSYAGFSRTGALSPTGTERVFDRSANGFVPAEAAVVMVLKRLADAERDGDRIYSVVKAIAGSSDGRAKGMTAPHPAGQMRAMRRAYTKAGIAISSVGLYEAHGTGTRLGDQTEVESFGALLHETPGDPGTCALGSLKSLFGHAKTCAGMLSLAKASLALHHGVLPAHTGVAAPIPPLADPASPLRLCDQPRPWLGRRPDPRRAAVSAFGFGGTNSHAVLEEYRPSERAARPAGADTWPHELFVFAGGDLGRLRSQLGEVRSRLEAGAQPRLRDLAAACARSAGEHQDGWAASAVVADLAELEEALRLLQAAAADPATPLPPHLGLEERARAEPGELAVLFPGQGAQYPGMGRALALYSAPFREVLAGAREQLRDWLPLPLDDYLFPPAAFDDEATRRFEERLVDTRVAQPAIGAISAGYAALLCDLGVEPAMLAGHSFGELTALHAAGALSLPQFIELAAARGSILGSVTEPGAMAAVFAAREAVERELAAHPRVVLANHNSDQQVVVSGPAAEIEQACERFRQQGWRCTRLRVSAAFHSPLMEEAKGRLSEYLDRVAPAPARTRVFSNIAGHRIDTERATSHLDAHLTCPVEFAAMVRSMADAGARVFVEVGPMGTLTSLLQTLSLPQRIRVIALDAGKQGMLGLLKGLGELWRSGQRVEVARLFEGRIDTARTLEQVLQSGTPAAPRSTSWWVDGHVAWPAQSERGTTAPAARWRSQKPYYDADQTPPQPQLAEPPAGETRPPVPNLPGPMPAHPTPSEAPSDPSGIYRAYAETVRAFLSSQERIFSALLGGAALPEPQDRPATAGAEAPAAATAPTTASPQPRPASPGGQEDERSPDLDHPPIEPERILLEAVAQVTGYPEDMLDLDADIEAELGIDSLRRVEIVDAVGRTLPGGWTAGLDDFARLQTLRAWLEVLSAGTAREPGQASPAAADAGAAPLEDGSGWLAATLLAVAEEVTGYPAEMLELGHDIEADLGVDSLRRVEIAEKIHKEILQRRGVDVQPAIEDMTAQRRLGDWLRTLEGVIDPQRDVEPPPSRCRRYLMAAQPMPLDPQVRAAIPGPIIVTRDHHGLAERVAGMLEQRGTEVHVIDVAAAPEEAIAAMREKASRVSGLIHLAGFDAGDDFRDDASWRNACERSVKHLIRWLQALEPLLTAGPGRDDAPILLSASALGGGFGRRDLPRDASPASAAPLGLFLSLEQEWPDIRTRCVDFSPELPAETIGSALIDELQNPCGPAEVGYTADGRVIYAAQPAPLEQRADAAPPLLSSSAVILATGGARGITAASLKSLAGPGMRVLLVGHQPLLDEQHDAFVGAETPAEIRSRIIAAAREAGLSRTPAAVEQEVQAVLRRREAERTIDALREAGVAVEYHACDVRDHAAFSRLLRSLQTRFPIDLVLHGAGVIDDRLLADKTPESIDRVFDTKVDAAYTLFSVLDPERVRSVVLFASTAGRFGNRGQADYAAANEVLNRIAWTMQARWPKVRVLSVNWGPWVGAGMVDPALQRRFERDGIGFITPDEGARFLRTELASPPPWSAEVIFGDAPSGAAATADAATTTGAVAEARAHA